MDVSDILTLARTQTYSTTTQITDANALQYLNIVYRDVINTIIDEDQGYFWQYATTDLDSTKNEYVLQLDNDKIIDVYVKYPDDDYYRKATKKAYRNIDRSEDWMNDNYSITNPIYVINDNSVFVYPKPESTVTEGLKMTYIERQADLESGDAGTDIKIPQQYHDILWIGMKQYIFAQKGMFEAQGIAFNEYSNWLEKLKAYIKIRDIGPRFQEDINLDYLK